MQLISRKAKDIMKTSTKTRNTEIKNSVTAADMIAQYDEQAKRLISNKIILSHIISATVDEFKGMKPESIVPYIEGEPVIGAVPIEPGLTNKKNAKTEPNMDKTQEDSAAQGGHTFRIVGLNTENSEINEGLIRFDIVFYVRMKDGISQVIVNIEIQKDMPSGYDILNRAVFYACRLISSQKERDFNGMNYNDIKRVFSIWICMNMKENSMEHIHLTRDMLTGSCERERTGGLDLINIVLIGLSDRLPEPKEGYELHRLLGTLLSGKLTVDEKLKIIETEYDIPIEKNVRKDVASMCNLGEGIMAEGQRAGLEKAELSAVRNLMLKLKMTAEQAMDTLDIETEKRARYMTLICK